MASDYEEKSKYKDVMYQRRNGELVQFSESFSSCKARKPNWTDQEIRVLIEGYAARRGVIRPRHRGQVVPTSLVDKQRAWEAITDAVNAVAGKECLRTAKEVQKKWENLSSKMKSELEQGRGMDGFQPSSTSMAIHTIVNYSSADIDTASILSVPEVASIKVEPVDSDEEMDRSDSFPEAATSVSTASSEGACYPVKLLTVPKIRKVEPKPRHHNGASSPPPLPEMTQYKPILPKPTIKTISPGQFSESVYLCPQTVSPQNVQAKLRTTLISRIPPTSTESVSASDAAETNGFTDSDSATDFTNKSRKLTNGLLGKRKANGDFTTSDHVTEKLRRQILVLKKRRLQSDIERIELDKERLRLEKEKLLMEKETVALAKEKITLELSNMRNILPLSYKTC